ncbi:hypothetical protein ZOD2009_05437 [Haladaptatus paucihalophilus DX253]|uniref:Uncharacterized protein n=2 Tax=Haladaptatus paucihalophilus DX253 TaxID=797209 RepID=E7QQL7_HALPU|nr:hypothetical protein ZOD2009_05437 [Haladaptatus paucihalophilus DX253]
MAAFRPTTVIAPTRITDRTTKRRDMRDEEEIREQYEFLKEQLESDDMNHQGIREMFTHYKRALGWTLEEEYI